MVVGAFFFVFILVFDLLARMINSMKLQFQLPKLTDFRRDEEEPLHIPFRSTADEKQILLEGLISSSRNSVEYRFPPLTGDPDEVLLEVSITQNVESSTEIELSLSDIEKKQNESIFLFLQPFNHSPDLQYPGNRLWFKVPPSRTLELRCRDVQPNKESVRLSALKIAILDWR